MLLQKLHIAYAEFSDYCQGRPFEMVLSFSDICDRLYKYNEIVKTILEIEANYEFTDLEEEILYYKVEKPSLQQYGMYYEMIYQLELKRRPLAIRYYKRKLKRMDNEFDEIEQYVIYHRSNSSTNDENFFRRNSSHNHIITLVLAHDMLVEYLNHKSGGKTADEIIASSPKVKFTVKQNEVMELGKAMRGVGALGQTYFAIQTRLQEIQKLDAYQNLTTEEEKFSDFVDINPMVSLKKDKIYSFIKMKDLNESQKFALPIQERELKGGSRFENGDTLFARITPCIENGKICQVKGLQDEKGFGSTEFLVFRGKEGTSDNKFVYYLSRSEEVRRFAVQNMVGSSGIQRVSWQAFENLELSLPDLPTQTAIEEILSSLDDKIELNNKINQELENLTQTLFKQWFIDFEFPNQNGDPYKSLGGEMIDSELGEIPKEWEVGVLDDILEVKGGTTPSTKEPSYWDGDFHWTSPRDLSNLQFPLLIDTDKKVTAKGLKKISSGLLPKGTLLLSSRAPIGYLAITEIETAINQGYIAINCKQDFSNIYLLYWLKQNMDSVITRANGSTFLEISKTNFKQIICVIPNIEMLKFYTDQIELLFENLRNNLFENQELTNQRDSLLPKLISGELEVTHNIK